LRLFKQELGMTFGSYLRVARIIRAIELLSDANTAVTDVAYSVGYRSLSSFSQTFQQLTGITPREYLKRFR
ncbi:MAG: helix-turn-helix transcriptional regulator, partial [Chloroflexota bacterium]